MREQKFNEEFPKTLKRNTSQPSDHSKINIKDEYQAVNEKAKSAVRFNAPTDRKVSREANSPRR
jgi:hypothetical protein